MRALLRAAVGILLAASAASADEPPPAEPGAPAAEVSAAEPGLVPPAPAGPARAEPPPPPLPAYVGGLSVVRRRVPLAPAPCSVRRGPIELREPWMLAQPRLTLPATSPDPVPAGEVLARFHVEEGNDFGYQRVVAEPLIVFGYLVDGEHRVVDLSARYGLGGGFDVGVRIPVYWRGPGFMDGIIDSFHEATAGIGFPDNDRDSFARDEFHVIGRDEAGGTHSWDDRTGTGLGNVELEGRWAFLRRCRDDDWAAAVVGRVGLPTGTKPFDTGSLDLGAQVVAAKRICWWLDAYAGVGGTFFSDTEDHGFEYHPYRFHAFFDLEIHPFRTWSLLIDVSGASGLITNTQDYADGHVYVNVGAKIDLTRRLRLEIGITEGLSHQQTVTDFGAFAGLEARF